MKLISIVVAFCEKEQRRYNTALNKAIKSLAKEQGTYHKDLIRKYMHYVEDCEGINFLENDQRYKSDSGISNEEWKELEEIADSISRR